jgi:uncharacterized protein
LFDREVFDVLTSGALQAEIRDVTSRPRHQLRIPSGQLDDLWSLHQLARSIEVHSSVTACRDKKDDFLLSLAQDGEADFLITRDEDLLVLKRWGQTTICTLEEFFQARGQP